MALQVEAINDGAKACFARYDKDIKALNNHITYCCDECDQVKELRVAEGKIEVLEECSHMQCEMINQLMARVEIMEGKLCHCGKGKDCWVLGKVSILGSPLVLGHNILEDRQQ